MSTPPKIPKVSLACSGRLVGWQVIDRAGQVTKESGGPNHNLILDQGLDLMATHGVPCGNTASETNGTHHGIQRFAAVGTSSTAPNASQTALGSEIARVSTRYQNSEDTDLGGGKWRRRSYFEFDFGVATGVNTEYGLSPSSSGDLAVRELFRDGNGNPVSVPVTADEKLRLIHDFEVDVSPITPAAKNWDLEVIDSNGNSTFVNYDGTTCWFGRSFVGNAQDRSQLGTLLFLNRFMRATGTWGQNAGNYWALCFLTQTQRNGLDPLSYSATPTRDLGTVVTVAQTFVSYTAGSYKRRLRTNIPTAQWNASHFGYQINGSVAFIFDTGQSITKTNEEILEIDLFELEWARAA